MNALIRSLGAWGLAAAIALPCEADQKPSGGDELAAKVGRLVDQLNSPELTARDEAERGLIDLGPAAIPHFPAADRLPAEAARRLDRARQALLTLQGRQAGQASLITFRAQNIPLADALAELAKQSGNRVVDFREQFGQEATAARVSVDFSQTPFWTALDNVCDQAKLMVYPYGGERSVCLVNRPAAAKSSSSRVFQSGAFRLEPVRFEAIRDLRNPANRSMRLFVEFAWEPRLAAIVVSQSLAKVRVFGENGEEITTSHAQETVEAALGEHACATELELPLALPDRRLDRLSKVQGTLDVLVAGPAETFEFKPLPVAAGTNRPRHLEQRKAGATVILEEVRKNNDLWEARVRVRFDDPGEALESHRTWILGNEVYMVAADGKRIDHGGYEQTRQSENEAGLVYLFELPAGPEGASFVYKTPTVLLRTTVEYELKDLSTP